MFIINLDALELRFVMKGTQLSPSCIYNFPSGLTLQKTVKMNNYNPQFNDSFEIVKNAQTVAYLYTRPIRNPYFIHKDIVVLKVVNWYLYQRQISNLIQDLIAGFRSTYHIDFEFHSFGRVDIAYDTDIDLLARFKNMFNRKSRYSFKNTNKFNVRGLGRYDTETTIGSINKRKKMIMIYDKTLELANVKKPYLSCLFTSVFGLATIYRCELRLFNTEINKYQIDQNKLDDPDYLLSVFKLYIDQMIDFRFNNNSNISRQSRVQFISLIPQQLIIPPVPIVPPQKTNNSIKHLVKQLYDESVGLFICYRHLLKFVAELFIKHYNLDGWCKAKNIRK
jgi:hypothetical protein